jgi:hypothetical protein
VRRIRLAALAFGGALAGASGAYLSVAYAPLWVEGMVAGRGWIALALTVFATWRPAGCCSAPGSSAVRVRRGRLESFELAPVIERHNQLARQLAEGARG